MWKFISKLRHDWLFCRVLGSNHNVAKCVMCSMNPKFKNLVMLSSALRNVLWTGDTLKVVKHVPGAMQEVISEMTMTNLKTMMPKTLVKIFGVLNNAVPSLETLSAKFRPFTINFSGWYVDMDTPTTIYTTIFTICWLKFLWGVYLSIRQRKVYKDNSTIPEELTKVMDANTFERARAYSLDKSSFCLLQGIVFHLLAMFILWANGHRFVWDRAGSSLTRFGWNVNDHEILHSLVFVFFLQIFATIIRLPFSIYNTFVIEQKYGFNRQTGLGYFQDHLLKFLIYEVCSLPVMAVKLKIILESQELSFAYLWMFSIVYTLFIMIICPTVIAPMFDNYLPLPKGSLRTKIEELATSLNFPLYGLYVVEGSKKSSHSNAFFYGFYKFKRIVLFDTILNQKERKKLSQEHGIGVDKAKKNFHEVNEEPLKLAFPIDLKGKPRKSMPSTLHNVAKEPLELWKDDTEEAKKDGAADDSMTTIGCSNNEILAVLGHELGHWKFNHVLKSIILSKVHSFFMLAIFTFLYKKHSIYHAFGFDGQHPVLFGLMIILEYLAAPMDMIFDFFMTWLSRRFEFQADRFAVSLGKAKHLKTSLIKLTQDNLSFPINDWLFSAWYHSHPSLLERIKAIDNAVRHNN